MRLASRGRSALSPRAGEAPTQVPVSGRGAFHDWTIHCVRHWPSDNIQRPIGRLRRRPHRDWSKGLGCKAIRSSTQVIKLKRATELMQPALSAGGEGDLGVTISMVPRSSAARFRNWPETDNADRPSSLSFRSPPGLSRGADLVTVRHFRPGERPSSVPSRTMGYEAHPISPASSPAVRSWFIEPSGAAAKA